MADSIPRHLLADLDRAVRHHRVVSVVGARQVGKSTLIRQLMAADPRRFVLLDLDDPAMRRRLVDAPAELLAQPGRCVVVDEAQRVPSLMLEVKRIVDRDDRPGQFVLTGSADLWSVQPSGVRDSLAGRAVRLRLWGLSQSELERRRSASPLAALLAGELPDVHGSALDRGGYLRRALAGGFPALVEAGPSVRREALVAYAESRTREDATDFGARRRHLNELPTLLSLIAARSALEHNVAALARDLPLSEKSVPAYVDLLEQLYLIDRIPAWSRNLRKRVVSKTKVIVSDAGLMAAVLGLRAVGSRGLNHEHAAGQLIETFVAGEVLRMAGLGDEEIDVRHMRTHEGDEVDLVLEGADGRIVGIEVKAGTKRSRPPGDGLRRLQESSGSAFVAGLILSSTPTTKMLAKSILEAPIDVLWRWPAGGTSDVEPSLTTRRLVPRAGRTATSHAPHEGERSEMAADADTRDAVRGPQMFIGYAHDDEDATGAVSTIEAGIKRAFRSISTPAQELEVFRDSSSLRWGDDWQVAIDAALDDTAFYVPVLSPRFFDSPMCRAEAKRFLDRVDRDPERRRHLVLPVYLIDVPDLSKTSPDLLKAKLAGFNWEDLREHVASAPEDAALRRKLWAMAKTVHDRVVEADPVPTGPVVDAVADDDFDMTEMLASMTDVEADGEAIAGLLDEVMEGLTPFFDTLGANGDPGLIRRAAEQAAARVEGPLTEAEEVVGRMALVIRQLDGFIDLARQMVMVGAMTPDALEDMASSVDATGMDLGEMGQLRQMMRVVGLTNRAMRAPMRRLDGVMVAFEDMMTRLTGWGPALRAAADEARG